MRTPQNEQEAISMGMRAGKWVVGALILIFIIMYLWPFASVPTGSRGVITQFGKIVGIEDEGLAILPPWRHLHTFSIRAEKADIEKADGSTSDTQPVSVSLTVRYNVRVDKVGEVYEKYSHDGDLNNFVQTGAQEIFKAVTARYTATDLIAKRGQVSGDIFTALQHKLDIYGANVISIDMRNFSFSDSYMKAINEKVTQEQLRQAADNQLKTVESQQKQKVAIAEAEASAAKATADGVAYSRLKVAEAEAKSLALQGDSLAHNPSVIELRRVEVQLEQARRWNGQLPSSIYAGAPIPFLNTSPAVAATK